MEGFNEAATFRPRNQHTDVVARNAEEHASMRPRPFGRGIAAMPAAKVRVCGGFNEAATFRPRNPLSPPNHDVHTVSASMRPRPFGRGIELLRRPVRLDLAASMRPRPFGRGIHFLADTDITGALIASMRPRPFGRGIGAEAEPWAPGRSPLQ